MIAPNPAQFNPLNHPAALHLHSNLSGKAPTVIPMKHVVPTFQCGNIPLICRFLHFFAVISAPVSLFSTSSRNFSPKQGGTGVHPLFQQGTAGTSGKEPH
jgi:hypothetical protein